MSSRSKKHSFFSVYTNQVMYFQKKIQVIRINYDLNLGRQLLSHLSQLTRQTMQPHSTKQVEEIRMHM